MDIFKKFREKYKAKTEPIPAKKISPEEKARKLALTLDAVFVNAPMLNPFKEDIQFNEEGIGWIQTILDTSNPFITENKYYQKVRGELETLLEQNATGIKEDDFLRIAHDVRMLYYDLQPQEYWEQKDF